MLEYAVISWFISFQKSELRVSLLTSLIDSE
jgi:hypothetical protein